MPILESFPSVLECNTIIFRTLKPSWYQEGKISSMAFMLLEKKDGFETGLSVTNNLENALKVFEKTKAVLTLHVGKIRDIDLDVVPDKIPNPKFDVAKITHAEIQGMPPGNGEGDNDLEAERFANKMLDMASSRTPVWERPIC